MESNSFDNIISPIEKLLGALSSVVFQKQNMVWALSYSVFQILSGFLLFVWGFLHLLAKLSRITVSLRGKIKRNSQKASARSDKDTPGSLPPGSQDVLTAVLKL